MRPSSHSKAGGTPLDIGPQRSPSSEKNKNNLISEYQPDIKLPNLARNQKIILYNKNFRQEPSVK